MFGSFGFMQKHQLKSKLKTLNAQNNLKLNKEVSKLQFLPVTTQLVIRLRTRDTKWSRNTRITLRSRRGSPIVLSGYLPAMKQPQHFHSLEGTNQRRTQRRTILLRGLAVAASCSSQRLQLISLKSQMIGKTTKSSSKESQASHKQWHQE